MGIIPWMIDLVKPAEDPASRSATESLALASLGFGGFVGAFFGITWPTFALALGAGLAGRVFALGLPPRYRGWAIAAAALLAVLTAWLTAWTA